MKLNFDVVGKHQPDPFIFEDSGKLYLYVMGKSGVEAYSADDLFGVWHYEGIVASFEEGSGHHSVIKYKGEYYAIYHGRDLSDKAREAYAEARTARVCKLHVKDGVITAERYADHM